MCWAAQEATKLDKESLELLSQKEKFYRPETVFRAHMSSEMDLIFRVYAQHNHYDDAVDRWIDLYERLLSKAEPVYLSMKLAMFGISSSDKLEELSGKNQRFEAERKYLKHKILKNDLGYLLSDAAAEQMSQMSLDVFAKLPAFQMLKAEDPFSEWKDPEVEVSDELAGLFKGSSHFVQMWIFYMQTSLRYGHRFAERVLSIQKEFLDQPGDGVGTSIEKAVHMVREEALRSVSDPLVIEVEGKTINVPFEHRLAVRLFLTDRGTIAETGDSPQLSQEDFRLTFDLAQCLDHAKKAATNEFGRLVDIATIVDEDSNG